MSDQIPQIPALTFLDKEECRIVCYASAWSQSIMAVVEHGPLDLAQCFVGDVSNTITWIFKWIPIETLSVIAPDGSILGISEESLLQALLQTVIPQQQMSQDDGQ